MFTFAFGAAPVLLPRQLHAALPAVGAGALQPHPTPDSVGVGWLPINIAHGPLTLT